MNKIIRRTLILASLLVAIIGAVLLIQYLFCQAASHDERRIGYYHNEPKDSIDVLFLGASEMYSGWAPGLAYEEYGFTSYPYCVSAAPVTMWKYMLEDALRTQSPELVVIDPYGATLEENDSNFGLFNPSPKYQFLNMVPFSAKKIEMVNKMCAGMSAMEKMSYLFPFVKHHDNISDYVVNYTSSKEIRQGKTSELKGMRTLTTCFTDVATIQTNTINEVSPITPTAEKYLDEFLRYCTENNIKVMFVHFPSTIYEGSGIQEANRKSNYVGRIVQSRGFEYINLQDRIVQMGIQAQEDFYSQNHLNVKGQKKVTKYLGKMIDGRIKKKQQTSTTKKSWQEASQSYEKYYSYACSRIEEGSVEYIEDGDELCKN